MERRTDILTDVQTDGCTDGRTGTNGQTDGRMDRWIDRLMDRWIDGRTNTKIQLVTTNNLPPSNIYSVRLSQPTPFSCAKL